MVPCVGRRERRGREESKAYEAPVVSYVEVVVVGGWLVIWYHVWGTGREGAERRARHTRLQW